MGQDLNKYWNDVRAVQAQLPKARIYYLVTIDNPEKDVAAGRVMDFGDSKQAARRIVERTHVLATAEQVAAWQAQQQKQVEELAEAELNRKGQLAMPKELQDLVRLAAQSVQKQTEPAPPPAKTKEKS